MSDDRQTNQSALEAGISGAKYILGNSKYDLSQLSERGNYILDMLETAEVNKLESANKTIDNALKQGRISDNDAEIMKRYYRQYLNS